MPKLLSLMSLVDQECVQLQQPDEEGKEKP